jgi:surfactin synthase thioesterase subunit
VAAYPAGRPQWFHPAEADPDPPTRLFLLHHSGGSASSFRAWSGLLPDEVAVQRVQLPGRHERRREPPYTHVEPLTEALAEALAGELDGRPYALFGHSMGALLAYRVAVTLDRQGWPAPALLAASGWAPPDPASLDVAGPGVAGPGRAPPDPAGVARRPPVDWTDEADVLRAVDALGDVPAELRQAPDALAAVLRVLRADAAVCASYRDDGAVVNCPVVAYAGRADPLVGPAQFRGWAARTPHYLGVREFPGDHFFVRRHHPAIAADLAELLRRQAVRAQP